MYSAVTLKTYAYDELRRQLANNKSFPDDDEADAESVVVAAADVVVVVDDFSIEFEARQYCFGVNK